jgi:hypothetical protein
MTVLIIIIVVVLLGGAIAGALVTKETLDRQKRIMKMKRFRNSVRPQKADYSPEDKRTMI